MSDHTSVIVDTIPNCDLCKQDNIVTPAYADAALVFGQWGYVCVQHFNEYGKGLGMGRGQRLLLEAQPERVLSEDDEDDVDPAVDTVFHSKEHEAAAKYLSDLIRKRDAADAKIPLTAAERTSWNKRIAKASVIMNVNAMKARR